VIAQGVQVMLCVGDIQTADFSQPENNSRLTTESKIMAKSKASVPPTGTTLFSAGASRLVRTIRLAAGQFGGDRLPLWRAGPRP
jgi:hypothetical protein